MNFDFIIVVVGLPEFGIKILQSGLMWHQKSCKNCEMYQFYSSDINFVARMTEKHHKNFANQSTTETPLESVVSISLIKSRNGRRALKVSLAFFTKYGLSTSSSAKSCRNRYCL